MMRGTFANVRIKNLMLPALPDGSREEGGLTLMQPGGQKACRSTTRPCSTSPRARPP